MRMPETGWRAPGQEQHDNAGEPADADGWTKVDHEAEMRRSQDNLRRAIAAQCDEAIEFEAGQVAAHARAIQRMAAEGLELA